MRDRLNVENFLGPTIFQIQQESKMECSGIPFIISTPIAIDAP